MLRARPMTDAPKDGTIVRLLVQWPTRDEGPDLPYAPLDDSLRCWTIGFNNADHNGHDVWQFVGWDWNQDCFVDMMDRDEVNAGSGMKIIGWHKLSELSTEDADETLRFDLDVDKAAALDAVERWGGRADRAVYELESQDYDVTTELASAVDVSVKVAELIRNA